MCLIMEYLHKYVPTLMKEQSVILPDGEVMKSNTTDMWEILFGGDQLTVARCRGATGIRSSHLTSLTRLEGLIPTVEDWHCRMTLLKV